MAEQSAMTLLDMGYDAIAASLIKIKFLSPRIDLPQNAHLIFTSRNAVRAFTQRINARHWPCLCVGDFTAEGARAAGFEMVVSVNGAADDVTAWAQNNIAPDTPVRHISGNHPRGEITERLRAFGFTNVARELFYKSTAITHDPRGEKRGDDIVLLYSPLAAKSLAALALDMSGMGVISMSASIDAGLGDISCKSRLIAALPRENSLFTHLPPI